MLNILYEIAGLPHGMGNENEARNCNPVIAGIKPYPPESFTAV